MRFNVPVTLCATVTVDAPTVAAAIEAARTFAEQSGPTDGFWQGWNSEQAPGAPTVLDYSGPDVESIDAVEVERVALAFDVVPQRDWFADREGEATRFEACAPAEATQWAVFDITGPGDADLVEDYPTEAAARAAVAALLAGEPLPDPVWPTPPTVSDLTDALLMALDGDILTDAPECAEQVAAVQAATAALISALRNA